MSLWRNIFNGRLLITFLMGFSSGIPILLTSKTIQGWMTEEKVDLKIIGLFASVGTPYALKFLWSPIFDRFSLPFLGRRRGWLFLTQIATMLSILFLAVQSPQSNLWMVAFACVLVSFTSASQDIVVDAFRRESLSDEELGLGSTYYVYGYRVAMWITGGLAFILASYISWKSVYLIMASTMLVGILTTLLSKEPEFKETPPRNFKESIIDPLFEFLKRKGAIEILVFILLYKLGDTMAGSMATPFYLKLGFLKQDIGIIAKTYGLFSSLAGGFVGGIIILRFRLHRSLWIFGLLQAISTFGFALLANIGADTRALTAVITFEDFTGGMGTAGFVAFMASQTNRRFTATQYALLTSLMAIPRIFIAAPTGYLAESLGWFGYFSFCTIAAIPGLVLLMRVAPWNEKSHG
jgi:PAT family beta-lactamase induction signal transducer AmpG